MKRLKAISVLAAVLGGLTASGAEATTTVANRFPGTLCQSINASSLIISNSAGVLYNDDTSTDRTIVCPVRMEYGTLPGNVTSVDASFVGSPVGCALRIVDYAGSIVTSASGTSSNQGIGGTQLNNLAITMPGGFTSGVSANLRCTLPAKAGSTITGLATFAVSNTF